MSQAKSGVVPESYSTINPYITVNDVPALIEFLQGTFDAEVTEQIRQPGGRIEHAEVKVGDSVLMIGPPRVDALVRAHEEHRPGTFYVFVADVDATYRKAVSCGAGVWQAPTETFYGDRVAAVTDRTGNVWWIATRETTLSAEQLQARAEQYWRDQKTPVNKRAAGHTPPAGYKTVNAYLTVADVPALIEFLQKAFGGALARQIRQPDGRVEHAEVQVGDSVLMIGPPQVDGLIRTAEYHRPGTFYLFVADVDATFRKALACGGKAWEQPTDTFYGDRVAAFHDGNGNRWWIARRERTLSAGELQERAEQRFAGGTWQPRKSVTKADVLEFVRGHRYAVEASITEQGMPEAALVGIVITDELELFFDSFDSTRKVANLQRNPRVAFVIGGQTPGDMRTVQYEGTVDSPSGDELEWYKDAYFAVHPDGVRRSRLPNIRYFRVRPQWIRYTNFNVSGEIVEFEGEALGAEHRAEGRASRPPSPELEQPWQPRAEPQPVFNPFLNPTRGGGTK